MDNIMNVTELPSLDEIDSEALLDQAATDWENGEWERGAEALSNVAYLCSQEQAYEEAAAFYMQIGLALLRVPNRAAYSCSAFFQAGLCYKEMGEPHGVAQSMKMLARHEFAAGNLSNGATILKEAVNLVADDVVQAADLMAMQANYEALSGDAKSAESTLTNAIKLTKNRQTRQQLRQLRSWYRGADEQQLLMAQLQQLAEQTQQFGGVAQLYDEALVAGHEQLLAGEIDLAVDTLNAVCDDAMEADDKLRGIRHFQATALLAQGYALQNNRDGALDALQTCREFMTALYGEEQAEPVVELQKSFAQYWTMSDLQV